MGKISSFGHRIVRLEIAPRESSIDALRLRTVDKETGQLLLSEAIPATERFLESLGYKWIVGSQGEYTNEEG